jgi:hemerythrin-like domain-containing protein
MSNNLLPTICEMQEPQFSPDNEEYRSKIFRYLFECEKQTNGKSPFAQIKNIMNDFKKSKQTAESYVIEFLIHYESVVEKYVPKKDQVYGELHYKTLSKNLQNYYKVAPYF